MRIEHVVRVMDPLHNERKIDNQGDKNDNAQK